MGLRIDKWLWYCRIYKTRGLAAKAVTGGKVHVNGERVKPSRALVPGDVLDLTKGQLAFQLKVTAIPRRRGPATEAERCYTEDDESRRQRLEFVAALKTDRAMMPTTRGRPDKRTRRRLREFSDKHQ